MPKSFLPSPLCYSNLTLIGFQYVYFPSDMIHYTQKISLVTLKNKRLLKVENVTLDQQCFQRKIKIKTGKCKKMN